MNLSPLISHLLLARQKVQAGCVLTTIGSVAALGLTVPASSADPVPWLLNQQLTDGGEEQMCLE